MTKNWLQSLSMLMACTSLLGLTSACHTENRPDEAHLVVLYTTDIHGNCLPFDFNKNKPAETSLANVSTYFNQVRKENPDGVLTLDAGDFLQGQPSMYYYNFVDLDTTHVYARIANYMQYDGVGVGNHDIEPGEAVYLDRVSKQLTMPWLCANAIDTRTNKPMFTPYAVYTRQGIKIAVLGMITPNIKAWLPKNLWPNLEFQDMVECAQYWVPIIEEKEKPDLLIGLFHSGGDYTINNSDMDTYKNENGGIPVATKVPGFDLVLLGHDHQIRQMDVVNVEGDTVKVIDAQTKAAKVGRADIALRKLPDNTYSRKVETSLIEMKNVPVDSAFVNLFAGDVKAVNDYVDKPLGTLTEPLYGEPGLYGPSEFTDLIHDVQLWATKADVSFVSLLSPNAKLEAGPLTMRDLFTLYKYENLLFTLKMTGDEIRRYLEFGYGQQFNQMKSANDHLLAYRTDENGNVMRNKYGVQYKTFTFNYTSAGGIKYVVDVSKPVGERVKILSMSDGKPFDLNASYKVAINSYQASGGGDFIPVGLGWTEEQIKENTIDATVKDVRKYVADYIENFKVITPRSRGDWQVIPTDWWKKGAANDRKMVNPLQR